MAEQYWIGGFFIDISRNQITQNKQSQTLAPKALAVLTYLAEHQGKVVSQDALLENVWPDTVVSPNSLQRSIAQLRKALGDDGKGQVFIKTHAKKGYSLECDVRWSDAQVQEVQIHRATPVAANEHVDHAQDNKQSHRSLPGLLAIAVAALVIFFVASQFFSNPSSSQLTIAEIRALTATDNKETSGIYSPDGKYVVFHRYYEPMCINSLWAKDLESQQEYRLTKDLSTNGQHSFSPDGNTLAFIQMNDCTQPINQKECYQLMKLDFHQAMASPQVPTMMMECKNSRIRDPIWIDEDTIAMLQQSEGTWRLIVYSVSENSSEVLYEVEGGNVIDYDFADGQIALTSINADRQHKIEILTAAGELLSSHFIKFPDEIVGHRFFTPNFTHEPGQFIFSTGRRLFTLSSEGEVRRVSLPLDQPVGVPQFHPDGTRMLVIKGHYDGDVVSVPLAELPEKNEQLTASQLTVIERSNLEEADGKSYSDGALVAFMSERTGEDQVWISDGVLLRQISQFPIDTYFYGLDWSDDGQRVLVSANNILYEVFVDGSQTKVDTEHPINHLYQWNSAENSALVLARVGRNPRLANVDISSGEIEVLIDQSVRWAQNSESKGVVYLDEMERFWITGGVENTRIEALVDQGSEKRFVIRGNVIYSVNDDNQFWSYDLDAEVFTLLGAAPSNLDYLTDVDDEHLYMSVRVSAKKELAELILKTD